MTEQKSILPDDRAARATLVSVMAIMCYLAALTLCAAIMIARAAADWRSDLASAVTVKIKPSTAMAPEAQIKETLRLLRKTPGIKAAAPLSPSEVGKLLAPWLGQGVVLAELPVPQLVNVVIDRTRPPDLAALTKSLTQAVPGASLDDHRAWNDQLGGFAARLTGASAVIMILVAFATTAIVVYATHTAMRTNRETVELLHLVGAKAGFISGEFERYFLKLSLVAGFGGMALAVLTLMAMGFSVPQSTVFIPGVNVTLADGFFLLLIPLICALVATLTARLTVYSVLRSMP